ncbi:MAG TPA: twin-arginine translocation signal domain-containing protein, partial [Persephonella sp.]|nr:twin-arginine translocation signal domain-containing protein [Persephonella sp.]
MQFFSREHLRSVFTKPTNYINTNRGDAYYKALYEKMRKRLDELKAMSPVREADIKFEKMLDMWELSRRDFLKWVSATTALLMLPPNFEPLVAEAAEVMNRVP